MDLPEVNCFGAEFEICAGFGLVSSRTSEANSSKRTGPQVGLVKSKSLQKCFQMHGIIVERGYGRHLLHEIIGIP